MKTKIFKLTALLLILAVSFSACNENEEPKEEFKNPYRDNIIGQWKLIEISVYLNYSLLDTTDYSNDNIIFDFQEDNKLIVTGSIPNDLGLFDDFQEGEHFYEYHILNVCPTCLPGPNLFIDEPEFGLPRHYFCLAISDSVTMSINGDKVIGGVLDETTGMITGGDYYRWGKTFVILK